MTRFLLAFSCFFRLLFGAKLNPKAADYLPDDARPKALPPKSAEPAVAKAKAPEQPAVDAKAAPRKDPGEPKQPEPPRPPKIDKAELHREGALAMLGLLQREGRLVDFLLESLDDYQDEDIGVAVRDIHRGCKKVIEDHLTLEPVMPGDEDDAVTVKVGFDPGELRLIGEVAGDPPFKGTLRHHGWRVTRLKFPSLTDGVDRRVLAPAEVEVDE